MMKIFRISLIIILLWISPLAAQEPDDKRMQRDLEVAEAVLNKLFDNEDRNGAVGVYVEGYGVMLKTPPGRSYSYIDNYQLHTLAYPLKNSIIGQLLTGEDLADLKEKEDKESAKEKSTTKKGKVRLKGFSFLDEEVRDSLNEEYRKEVIERMQTFFLNYADLIAQLGPEDRIRLIYDSRSSRFDMSNVFGQNSFFFRPELVSEAELSMEVRKKDLNAYRGGDIQEKEFLQRIKLESADALEKDEAQEMEYEILAGVFEKVLDRAENDLRVIGSKKVPYSRLDNFGIIYELNFNPSLLISTKDTRTLVYREGNLISEDVSSEPASSKENLCEDIIQACKEYMVQYGRTLRSLEANEVLVLNILLPRSYHQSDDCPERIRLSLQKSVLNQYDKATLSFEAALKQIKEQAY